MSSTSVQSDHRTMVPPSTETVEVETAGRGVRLVVEPEPRADGADAGMLSLLERYSPVFVVFPEVPPAGQQPFDPPSKPKATHDYHPRPVELFLASPPAQSIHATPGDVLSWGARILGAYALIAGPAIPLLAAAEVGTGRLALSVLAAVAGAAIGEAWLRIRSAPAPSVVTQRDQGSRPGRRRAITRLSLLPDPRGKAWNAYREQLAADPGRRTSYTRVCTTADGELYLQYWQFYVFNDWDNWHEADWEVVMVRLGRDGPEGRKPIGAAYSSHLGGLWRDWSDVKHARDDGQFADSPEDSDATHPIVWVALGSHAQYFESMNGQVKAKLTQRWGFAQYGGWLSLSSDATDRVAAEVSSEEPGRYVLHMFSDDAWWLKFEGFWGGHEGIRGPAIQGLKWRDPVRWVDEQCVGDPGVWSSAPNA